MKKLNGWEIGVSAFILYAAISVRAQTFATLVNFDWSDGANPAFVSLSQGLDGTLYGTTYAGGTDYDGTAFKVTQVGALTTLAALLHPEAGLVLSSDGNLYGTMLEGGANGYGAVFKITPSGNQTILHSFDGSDGSYPYAALIQATDGSLYGTTAYGGMSNGTCFDGCGTVFRMARGGTFTTLHNFAGSYYDGADPMARLAQGTDGMLYGTTYAGGIFNAVSLTAAGPSSDSLRAVS